MVESIVMTMKLSSAVVSVAIAAIQLHVNNTHVVSGFIIHKPHSIMSQSLHHHQTKIGYGHHLMTAKQQQSQQALRVHLRLC
jgi:acetylglutamate synthase